jgi:GNAT superfamily N-acetyltransferase
VPSVTATVRDLTGTDDLTPLTELDPLGWEVHQSLRLTASMPDYDFIRIVAEEDGALVGYCLAAPYPFAAGGFGIAMMFVHPDHRRRGTGGEFRRRIHDGFRGRVPGVMLHRVEGIEDSDATAAAWGLRETGRHQESFLDLTTFDRSRFEELGQADGIEFVPLRADLDDAGWQALRDYAAKRALESPDSGGDAEFLPVEAFRASVPESWMLMTAEHDGRPLGITFVVRRPGTEHDTNTWFTGVAPEARGRGLSTALKARQAIAMADAGIETLFTQNMDGNEPILRANRTLGFQRGLRLVDGVEEIPAAAG